MSLQWRIGLAVAYGLLVLVHWGLRHSSYRRMCRLLLSMSPTPNPSRRDVGRARALGRLVNQAALRYPAATCIRRSLVTWWLMRWSGLPSDLCTGVRFEQMPDDEPVSRHILGHMWLEHHGAVINDRLDIRSLHALDFSDDLDPLKLLT